MPVEKEVDYRDTDISHMPATMSYDAEGHILPWLMDGNPL